MTRTISLITATVGAALLFAVPAWGDNWASDKAQPTTVSPDWFERAAAVAVEKQDISHMLNARERALGVAVSQSPNGFDARSDGLNRLYGLGEYSNPIDARERALVIPKTTTPQPQGFDARSDGMNRLYRLGEYSAPVVADFDRFQIVPSNEPVTVSSRDIEWPTVGYGLGIALVLMVGLLLALKATQNRPFAH